ncbi:MAG: TonB-dependent receptor, partial [Candidatus Omnitrophota bacterium]|nr:TonB-dependent receptor [Candidatus Omnitrophota bacterium]
DWVDFDFDDRNTVNNSKTEKMSKITPRCSLVYMYQRDSSFYANYAQAFRTPTIGQMFTYGASANTSLVPEEAVNYEMGLHHFFNEFLKANISLYWMELDNEIWLERYEDGTSKYQNYGKTSHKGIETGLDFKINKSWSIFANYTYSRAKNENGSNAGKYLTNIPIHKASSGLHFTTEFGLSWDLIVAYIGSSYIDSTNDNKLSSYVTADTKISYQYKMMKIFLAVDNLLDKEYNLYGSVSGTPKTKYFNPAPGRTFTLGAEAKF